MAGKMCRDFVSPAIFDDQTTQALKFVEIVNDLKSFYSAKGFDSNKLKVMRHKCQKWK